MKFIRSGVAKILVSLFCATVLGAIGFRSSVFALDEKPDYWIQASPANITLNDLKPGATTTTKFQLINDGNKEFGYKLTVGPYSVSGDDYKEDYLNETVYTDIAKWISFDKSEGVVEPGAREDVRVTIKVPKDVPAGGQYAVLWAELIKDKDNDDNAEASGVRTAEQVGVILYSNVEGETRRTGGILENRVPSFLFQPPVQVSSVVENTGNVHVNAQYILQVFPLFGDEEVYTNEEQPKTVLILPETRKLSTVSWDGAPQLGIFRVKQTVKFMDEENVTEKVVFICPLWFLFIVLAVVFLAVFWIISRVRGRRKEQA